MIPGHDQILGLLYLVIRSRIDLLAVRQKREAVVQSSSPTG